MLKVLSASIATLALSTAIAAPATATSPGKEGRIAINVPQSPGTGIATVTRAGRNQQPLTPTGVLARWSSDGETVAWFDPTKGTVTLANADGSNARQVGDKLVEMATLTPDGKTVIALKQLPRTNPRRNFVRSDLIAVDVATGKERLIAYDARYPAISPDGKTVAFIDYSLANRRYRGKAIATVKLNGKSRKIVYRGGLPDGLDWSPDGKTIAFSDRFCGADCTPPEIRLLTVKTGKSRRLVRPKQPIGPGVSWSPTGKRLATMLWNGSGDYDLVTVDAKSGAIKRLGVEGAWPSWQPLR